MKILFLVRSLDGGGAERQLTSLATGLKARGHEVSIALFYEGGVFETEAVAGGVELHQLGKSGRWDLLGFGKRFLACVRRVRPDVIYSFLGESNVVNTALKDFNGGATVVCGVRSSYMDMSRYDFVASVADKVGKLLMRRADQVIANSDAGVSLLAQAGISRNIMQTVHNGFDLDTFSPDLEAGRRWRKRWRIPDERLLVGMVGRLDPMKDHETFFRAAKEALRKDARLTFVVVGGGNGEHADGVRTSALARELGERVVFTGRCDDMHGAYNGMDIHCLSSFGEGFPNVVGESLACGVPNVVTDVGDVRAFEGVACTVVPVGDSAAMAEAVLSYSSLSSTELNNVGDKARELVITRFSRERMVERTENALLEMLG